MQYQQLVVGKVVPVVVAVEAHMDTAVELVANMQMQLREPQILVAAEVALIPKTLALARVDLELLF
jgi:hypothetical protein